MKHTIQEKNAASIKTRVNSDNQEKIRNQNAYSVLKTSKKGIQTKESRTLSQDEILKVFHPKQDIWNGEKTKL